MQLGYFALQRFDLVLADYIEDFLHLGIGVGVDSGSVDGGIIVDAIDTTLSGAAALALRSCLLRKTVVDLLDKSAVVPQALIADGGETVLETHIGVCQLIVESADGSLKLGEVVGVAEVSLRYRSASATTEAKPIASEDHGEKQNPYESISAKARVVPVVRSGSNVAQRIALYSVRRTSLVQY